jgi:hypothetical protein
MSELTLAATPIAGAFVYVRGLRGPEPEKWPSDAPAGVKVGKHVIAKIDLAPDLYALPIAELERRYPLEARP